MGDGYMQSEAIRFIQKDIVLVGAGNAHLGFIRMHQMNPIKDVQVTLINETGIIPYSAMVPGTIGGDYQPDEITIDLVQLCAVANVRLVVSRAEKLDCTNNLVFCEGRAELRYDAISLGLGSLPKTAPGNQQNTISMRPLLPLMERLQTIESQLQNSDNPFHLVIVGGGASGCELALAIQKKFTKFRHLQITILQGNSTLLNGFNAKAQNAFLQLLNERGIEVSLNSRVTGIHEKLVSTDSARKFPFDLLIWATNAEAHPLITQSNLAKSNIGFLRVNKQLQSVSNPSVFGTGDCISIENHPELPKNGVHAVRQGKVLFKNMQSFLRDQQGVEFKPQKKCLALLNTADGNAAMVYGGLYFQNKVLRTLKDRIDKAWVQKFRPTQITGNSHTKPKEQMRCGGCGSKISSNILSSVLKRLDTGKDERIIIGCEAGDDASAHIFKPELYSNEPENLVEVQTVDYFKTFTPDTFFFGQISALHAISDLFAMNARPFSALAIATLPYARGPVQEGMLFELLSGAVSILKNHGITLSGGHTTEGNEMGLGFSVTGFAERKSLFQKSRLKPGQKLILTKPLGTGAILAGFMQGMCKASWFEKLKEGMLRSNQAAAKIFSTHKVEACTDITGFGLAGHLLEMLDSSGLSSQLALKNIRKYDGFEEIKNKGILSTLHEDNTKVSCRFNSPAERLPAELFDPQTSGGLLAGVNPESCDQILKELFEAGYKESSIIGTVIEKNSGPTILLDMQ